MNALAAAPLCHRAQRCCWPGVISRAVLRSTAWKTAGAAVSVGLWLGHTVSAAPPRPVGARADALVDSRAGRGEVLTGRSDRHGVASVRARFLTGVAFRRPSSLDGTLLADAVLSTPDRSGAVRLELSHESANSVTFRTGASSITVVLNGGRHPGMRVTNLPVGTTEIEVATSGRGNRILRLTAPCRSGERSVRTRTTLSFADGTPARSFTSQDNTRSCSH